MTDAMVEGIKPLLPKDSQKLPSPRDPFITDEGLVVRNFGQRVRDAALVTFVPKPFREGLVPPYVNPDIELGGNIMNKAITYSSLIAAGVATFAEHPVAATTVFSVSRFYRFFSELVAREADAIATNNNKRNE